MFRFLKRLLSRLFNRTDPAGPPQDPYVPVREPRPRRPGGREPQSFTHRAGLERLTGVTIAGPYPPAPDAVAKVAELQFINTKEHRLELTFDEGRQKRRVDFQPTLPLVVVF
jgi:hypothetical protein